MKIYEFGSWDAPVMLLLPGTCCHWKKNFGHVVPLLRDSFHVICVSYDGFDETEDSLFTDVTEEVEKLEHMLLKGFGGHIFAAYGCSLGGSLVGLMLQRGVVRMDHAFLGSSDLDQEDGLSARIKAALVAKVLHGVMQRGKLPGWMQKRLDGKSPEDRAYMEKMLAMMGLLDGSMKFVRRESIRSQFYSDLVTPLKEGIDVPGTKVHCFYAAKMGEQYLARYRKHFRNPDVVSHDLQHEELLISRPEEWAAEVRRCCGM